MNLATSKESHSLKLNLDETSLNEQLVRSPTPVKTLRIDLDTDVKETLLNPIQVTVSQYNPKRPAKYGNLVLKVHSRPI